MSKEWRGIPVSPGIAIGKLYCYRPRKLVVESKSIDLHHIEQEISRFESSLVTCRQSLERTRVHAEEVSGHSIAKIFEAQLLVLEDEYFLEEMRIAIRESLVTAESAVYNSMQAAIGMLSQRSDPVFRERASDLRDVCQRLLTTLLGIEGGSLELTEPVILAAEELTPSELIHIPQEKLLGIALDEGGETSHSAILARVFGVPAIVGLKHFSTENNSGTLAAINGISGKMIVNPDEAKLTKYRFKINELAEYRHRLDNIRDSDARTTDGTRVNLNANIELPVELKAVREVNADGVGLFRTEYLYLSQEILPDEEEQYLAYKEVAEKLYPRPVTIRTFDLGGDKVAKDWLTHKEPNPFMGWRAIRVSLTRPEIFRTQLRAIARAAVIGNIEVMFPMIIGLNELRQAKTILQDVCDELTREGIPNRADFPIGVMIEVPSAALLIDLIIKEVDFISIGTNDLTQFTLAVDRSNHLVTDLYQPFHLSVLRLVKSLIEAGALADKKVSLCGELAGNAIATILLVGMGLRHFSMSPLLIPEVKSIVQSITLEECQEISRQTFEMTTSAEITEFLKSTIRKRFANLPIWFGR